MCNFLLLEIIANELSPSFLVLAKENPFSSLENDSNKSCDHFSFLDEVSTLSSDHECSIRSYTFDLCVNGNDLVVPLYGDNNVYWFELQ